MAHRDGPGPSTGPEDTSPQPGEPLDLRPLRRRPVAAFATGVAAGVAGAVLVMALVMVLGPGFLDRVQDGLDTTVGADQSAGPELVTTSPASSAAPSTAVTATTRAPARPTTTTSPAVVADLPRLGRSLAGRHVAAVGDSLLESVEDALAARLAPAEVDIDAQQSRPVEGGIGPLRRLTDGGADIVVVALGTNDVHAGFGFESAVEEIVDQARGAACFLWVDVQEFRPELESVNETIHEVARQNGITVVEWSEVAGPSELHAADGYHLSPAGRAAFADLIADGVRDCPPAATQDADSADADLDSDDGSPGGVFPG